MGQTLTEYEHSRILAADDEPSVQQLYRSIFSGRADRYSSAAEELNHLISAHVDDNSDTGSEFSFDCSVVDQGEKAVALAEQALAEGKPYTVALLDMRMPPGMDGLETAKRLRALDDRIYIVFVTAYADRSVEELHRAMEYGTLFMRKPFVREEILQTARMLSQNWSKDRRLEQSVSRAEMEAVNSAMRAKDDFLASMSHELRTPLTAIIGNSEFLAESSLDDDQHDLLRSIEVSSLGLLALINDILDLSKIAAGKFAVDHIPFDLNEVIDEVGYIFAARAHEAGLSLKIDHPEFTSQIIGDGRRINQVLINLLSNAIKFTESGTVELAVWTEADEKELHFRVKDEGIGMTSQTLRRLFKPFTQADSTISGRFGGTGLGLHITWTLVDLMSGEINVESVEGEGSCFHIVLPLEVSDLPVSKKRRRCFVTLDCYFSGSVLIAEDAPELQSLERRMLKSMGLDVTVADNGKEAVDLALSEEFDVVLMDMQMPEMDGIEATELLRSIGYDKPIVALTANVMAQHQEQFEAAGCTDFLAKPIDRHRLQEVLGQFLKACSREEFLERQKGEPDAAIPSAIVDDELTGLFIERTRELRDKIVIAVEQEDWDAVRINAHTVKGSGTTFGYPQLTSLGKEVCDSIDHKQMGPVPALTRQLLDEMHNVLSDQVG